MQDRPVRFHYTLVLAPRSALGTLRSRPRLEQVAFQRDGIFYLQGIRERHFPPGFNLLLRIAWGRSGWGKSQPTGCGIMRQRSSLTAGQGLAGYPGTIRRAGVAHRGHEDSAL